MGHFDLAKFWSEQGAHRGAFEHWQAAHALLRPIQPFARRGHLAFIEANIAAFPAARFVNGLAARNADPTPVFIVGMPRSGTTLCERILAAHARSMARGSGLRLDACSRAMAMGLRPSGVSPRSMPPRSIRRRSNI
jgi:hypothetical protein